MINKTLLVQSRDALESLNQVIEQVDKIPAKGSPWEILSWVYFQLKNTRDQFEDHLDDWEQEYKDNQKVCNSKPKAQKSSERFRFPNRVH